MSFNAYAARERGGALEPFDYDADPLGADDVEIEITHCGICHSDVHLVDDDWGISRYPLVPGHEIVGVVKAKGDDAEVEIGARVGVGWQRGSCGECEWCERDEENVCPDMRATCVDGYGGFADRIRIDGRFVLPIPERISSEAAGPLFCGGVTVFAPALRWMIDAKTKVGVVGVGGLGHLALQFSRAMGCETTAFSSTPAKEEEARGFGADRFVVSTDAGEMKSARNLVDFLLVTASADIDWRAHLAALRPNGVMCVVGAPPSPICLPAGAYHVGQKTVTGSAIGSPRAIRETLQFAADHGVRPQTELYPFEEADRALARTRANEARYRVVLGR
ncbi:MAG: alcohol dehydrogenase catalytic domain-containing protein [Ignavibacteriales bacterium]|nr:alcohol dehydrogenase catalytic domain-containing protein [Ignavibacteriales bacterium]